MAESLSVGAVLPRVTEVGLGVVVSVGLAGLTVQVKLADPLALVVSLAVTVTE
jgi:hypothetical protein